jgi:ABC-type sugar transport system ATPase subunit
MDVDIEDLRFGRGGRVLLDIPSLRVRSDRTTVILGPNGAGKTTLLRLIAGLERAREGRILVGGSLAGANGRRRHDLAYVFQEDVFLRQSVRANLDLGLRLRGLTRRERTTRIDRAADLLGIAHLLECRADRLSGGEGRRASLARAVCLQAPLVLLDEPLARLDPPTASRLLDELPRLLQAFGATTVLVTHDRHEALRLGQDLVVLIDGRVHAAGATRDVVSKPAGSAMADLLGYVVLCVNGRRVAVPPDALRPGSGAVEFYMVVEDLVDLVSRRELVGRVEHARVRVPITLTDIAPPRGERLLVHSDWVCDLD